MPDNLRQIAEKNCEGCRLSWRVDKEWIHYPPMDGYRCRVIEIRKKIRRLHLEKEQHPNEEGE